MATVLTRSPTHRRAGIAYSRRVGALHVFGLSAFAFAQPLYDLLGAHPAFFVAHRAQTADILAFVAGLTLLLPALIVAVTLGLSLIGPRLAWVWHLGVVWGLASIVMMPVPGRAGLADGWSIGLALLLAAITTVAYAGAAAVRTFVTVLSIASIVFPAMFLMRSEMRGFWLPHRLPDAAASESRARAVPVVMLVFDELSLDALLDAQGQIDAARYPAFGHLAATSYWFRHATTVSDSTVKSVPALLTGRFPHNRQQPATAAAHPDNLFTLLAPSHDLNVVETVTELCPPSLCAAARKAFGGRMTSLFSDAAVVFLHWCLPEGVRPRLPSLSGRWAGFSAERAPEAAGPRGTQTLMERILRLVSENRQEIFQRFVGSIDAPRRPPVHFLHVLLPHTPHEYLPSGRTFGTARFRNPMVGDDRLTDAPDVVAAAYRRYLLQVQHVDRLLGTLWERLERQGLFEDALIVVTSDHGVSYRAGGNRRVLDDANLADVLPVPLFIKLPGQTDAIVSDRPAELIDVLPTVAEVIGAQPSWTPDGVSLLADPSPMRTTRRAMRTNDGRVFEYPAARPLSPSRAAAVEMFGQGADLRLLFASRSTAELIGTPLNHWPVEPSNATVELDDPVRFADVRLSSNRVPVDITGRLHGLAPDTAEVAVVINGTVAAAGPVFRDRDGAAAFEALISDEFLVDGPNEVEVFTIARDASGGHSLSRVPARFDPAKLRLGADRISRGDGSIVRLGGSVNGYLDQIATEGREVVLTGWAFLDGDGQPAEQLLLFSGESVVATTRVSLERPDVAEHFRNPRILNSGYVLRVPIDRWRHALADSVSLVATAGNMGVRVPWTPRYDECQVRRLGLPDSGAEASVVRMAREAQPLPGGRVIDGSRTFQVVNGAAAGYVESLADTDGCTTISGWALDTTSPDVPVTVVVVQDGRIVRAARPTIPRDDVARTVPLSQAFAGFELAVLTGELEDPTGRVRIYAINGTGRATELQYLWHTRTPR
jgi:hypothetical protein